MAPNCAVGRGLAGFRYSWIQAKSPDLFLPFSFPPSTSFSALELPPLLVQTSSLTIPVRGSSWLPISQLCHPRGTIYFSYFQLRKAQGGTLSGPKHVSCPKPVGRAGGWMVAPTGSSWTEKGHSSQKRVVMGDRPKMSYKERGYKPGCRRCFHVGFGKAGHRHGCLGAWGTHAASTALGKEASPGSWPG